MRQLEMFICTNKHIQNQNEKKINCEDFLVHCHIIEHLKSIDVHQIYNKLLGERKKDRNERQTEETLINWFH